MTTKWDLTKLYENEADFEKDLKTFKEVYVPKIATFEGKLGEEKSFIECLQTEREVNSILERLYLYSACASDFRRLPLLCLYA